METPELTSAEGLLASANVVTTMSRSFFGSTDEQLALSDLCGGGLFCELAFTCSTLWMKSVMIFFIAVNYIQHAEQP